MRISRGALTAYILLASFGLAGCTFAGASGPGKVTTTRAALPEPSSDEGDRVLSFGFDDLPAPEEGLLGPGKLSLGSGGAQQFDVVVSTAGGGTLRSVGDPTGGRALRFPAYAVTGTPRAVAVVSSASVTDPLGPGTSSFTFGADFTLDARSEGGVLDNGNNLLQRGLNEDPAQYKLQIDHGRASCRVAGVAGEVVAQTAQLVKPATWYHVSCTRNGDQVTLKLGAFGATAEPSIEVGATGAVYVSSHTPLVLGGKATSAGAAVVSDSDQFNGAIDNVFLDLHEEG
jgi:hypothetical protein